MLGTMVLTKAMYSLEEAEKISRNVADHILEQAAAGKEKLYVKMPKGMDAFSVDFVDVYPSENPTSRKLNELHPPALPIKMQGISFLEIFDETCSGVINNGYSQQAVFRRALSIANDGTYKTVQPERPADAPLHSLSPNHNSFLWYFACYRRDIVIERSNRASLGYPTVIDVEPGTAFVTRLSLSTAIERASKPVFDPSRDLPIIDAPHISRKLLRLRNLLIDRWNMLGPDGFPMPSLSDLAAQLLKEYGFASKKQAEGGAAALRLSVLSEDDLTGELRLTAPGITALIECADLHWMHALNGSQFEFKTEEMVSWLQARAEFSRYAAEGCIALIRPESVSRAGRKRKL